MNLKVKLQMLHKQIGIGSEHGGSTAAYPLPMGCTAMWPDVPSAPGPWQNVKQIG